MLLQEAWMRMSRMRMPMGGAVALAIATATGCVGASDERDARAEAEIGREMAATYAVGRVDGQVRHVARVASVGAERGLAGTPIGRVGRVDRTIALLSRHKALVGMRAPAAELVVTRDEDDALGMSHVRFSQSVRGVPVIGAEAAVHYDADERVTSIHLTYVPGLEDLDLEPTLTDVAARAAAEADVLRSGTAPGPLSATGTTLSVFTKEGQAPRLAFETAVRTTSGPPATWSVVVDARTGAVLERLDLRKTVTGSGAGVHGDTKTFGVSANASGYSMVDTSRAAPVRTYTASNGFDTPGVLVTSPDPASWDTDAPAPGSAVDAHYHAGQVYDFWLSKLGRRGIDGSDGPLVSTVHYGQHVDNAYWLDGQIVYGDGGSQFKPLAGALDVAAHEFTHGVTERLSRLRYEGQSGALNETISDVFGALVEHAYHPDDVDNWRIGEGILYGAEALRDLASPTTFAQPTHMSKYVKTSVDNGGVHVNNGISNNAAYLMTMGGVNPVSQIVVSTGIGHDKSARVWHRANERYLLERSDFLAASRATLDAARDLGLSPEEQQTIACAWRAVGVGDAVCSSSQKAVGASDTVALPPPPPTTLAEPVSLAPSPAPREESFSCAASPAGKGPGTALVLGVLALIFRAARRRAPRTPTPGSRPRGTP